MLSLFNTAKKILKSFFTDNLFNLNDILSEYKINALIKAIDKGVKKDVDKVINSVNKEVRGELKKKYNQFVKRGVFQVSPNIQKYKIEDLKPDYKKELARRTQVCLSYITTQDRQTVEEIKNRVLNFATTPHIAKDLNEFESDFWNNVLPEKTNKNYKSDKIYIPVWLD